MPVKYPFFSWSQDNSLFRFIAFPKQVIFTVLSRDLYYRLPVWECTPKVPLVLSAPVCLWGMNLSELYGFLWFVLLTACFVSVWGICSVAHLLDQLALSTAVNTKSCKQMEKFNFQLGKGSIATSEWNICLVTFTGLLLQTKSDLLGEAEGETFKIHAIHLFQWRLFLTLFQKYWVCVCMWMCVHLASQMLLTSFNKLRLVSQITLKNVSSYFCK